MEERNEEIMTVPMSAQEITGELMEEIAERAAQEDEELAASLREGIGMLFEDGFVKKPSGAKPGFVIFTNQTTLYVTPEAEVLQPVLLQEA